MTRKFKAGQCVQLSKPNGAYHMKGAIGWFVCYLESGEVAVDFPDHLFESGGVVKSTWSCGIEELEPYDKNSNAPDKSL